jgi:hypothetical protein
MKAVIVRTKKEINKNKWHQNFVDQLALQANAFSIPMSVINEIRDDKTRFSIKDADKFKEHYKRLLRGKMGYTSNRELQELDSIVTHAVERIKTTYDKNKRERLIPRVAQPITPLAAELFSSDDEWIDEVLGTNVTENNAVVAAIERASTPITLSHMLDVLDTTPIRGHNVDELWNESGEWLQAAENIIQATVTQAVQQDLARIQEENERKRQLLELAGDVQQPPTLETSGQVVQQENVPEQPAALPNIQDGGVDDTPLHVSGSDTLMDNSWDSFSSILNLTYSGFMNAGGRGLPSNWKLRKRPYKREIQYIGGLRFVPIGMNPWPTEQEDKKSKVKLIPDSSKS